MKDPLMLVAASGLARETLEAARAQGRYEVIGFVDDDQSRHGELFRGVKVLGGLDVLDDHADARVLICAGKGSTRDAIVDRLTLDPARYARVVHPTVSLPPSCDVGAGSILLAGCVMTTDVTIGRHVVLMPHVTLTHDDAIEDFATLCAGVILGGAVIVGRCSYIGMQASVRERVRIGARALVGMGAAVLNDVPAGEIWQGVPARPASIRPRDTVENAP